MIPNGASDAILIVDDNPANLEVLSEALTSAGYRVAVAVDGESAIKQVKYRLPELILLDIMMPEIDGFETCRRLKADLATKDIPVIFMTALSDIENKVKGLSVGAVDYITKPFQHEEVISRVKIHIQLRNYGKTMEAQNQFLKQEIEQRKQVETALKQALDNLQRAQVQMIQNEKMSALGQLVAGIAHEINNPVNFIYGNISHANEYIQTLLDLLSLYREQCCIYPLEVHTKTEDIDLDFLIDDLPKLISSMQVGADRIREIVTSLRTFSRIDEAKMKPVNIHEGIDSTLMLLQSRLQPNPKRPGIEVIKSYGKLPLVECYAGNLNQVFMNILLNAIDAIEQREIEGRSNYHPVPGSTIRICTEVTDNEQVVIRIADNGIGIPQTTQKRLFDPFFTTKPVGKGTGLGLSISYQIVLEHGGDLTYSSRLGEGTEFAIAIPIRQPATIHPSVLSEISQSMIK